MNTTLKAALIGSGTLLAAAAIAAGTLSPTAKPAAVQTPLPAAVKTQLPGLTPASGEPDLPGLRDAHPAPGQVVQAAGPFDDRFALDRVVLSAAGVTGGIHITSDVSDLLELQIVAGFYDNNGNLLATGRYEHHLEENGHSHAGTPTETEDFSIPVPVEAQGKAVAASIGVPVLVNE